MMRLQEKYGNVHTIIGLLIDEIKLLRIVRRGDFDAFEILSMKVNEFYEKLVLMGKREDTENSYVLKEIESKFNTEDYQKWLEYCGDRIDYRRVGDLVTWLDKQTHIRRITHKNSSKDSVNLRSYSEDKRGFRKLHSGNIGLINQKVGEVCKVCNSNHLLNDCSEFTEMSLKDRWDRVKVLGLCFLCLKVGHRRTECEEKHCKVCSGKHHQLLHSYSDTLSSNMLQLKTETLINSSSLKDRRIERSFLTATVVTLSNKGREVLTTAVMDSGSEINIITPRCCRKLNLKGVPAVMNIVGAGGATNNIRTEIAEMTVKDKYGEETIIECIVLNKACGKILSVDEAEFDENDK